MLLQVGQVLGSLPVLHLTHSHLFIELICYKINRNLKVSSLSEFFIIYVKYLKYLDILQNITLPDLLGKVHMLCYHQNFSSVCGWRYIHKLGLK